MSLDRPFIGFIVGLLLPVLGVFLVYLAWGHGMGFGPFLSSMTHNKVIAPKVILLGLLTNLIPFVYVTTKRLDYAMRGIFVATMLYAVFIILIMFVW